MVIERHANDLLSVGGLDVPRRGIGRLVDEETRFVEENDEHGRSRKPEAGSLQAFLAIT
jgi:hypothetical protein